MSLTILPWQQAQWQQLQAYLNQQRIPQALLITGRKGLGKQQLATLFAHRLLCTALTTQLMPCGQCHSCKLLKAQTHPDFITVQPDEEGKGIGIDKIRTLITRLTLKPQFETQRVVIVSPADKMNNAASNAFLKCLEEPTERTTLLLLSDRPSKLPATIASRCQKLAISVPSKAATTTWLQQQGVKASIDTLIALAQGAPLLALHYASDDALTRRNHCFQAWLMVAQHKTHPVLVADDWQKQSASALLFWLSSWLIDLIRLYPQHQNNSAPRLLYNPDLADSLRQLTAQIDLKALYRLYDKVLQSRQLIDTPINQQLLYEELLIQWTALNRRSPHGRINQR
ncbi:MAG: DNA polymerase III subunit delta' [Methylococcaceae bacterium]